MPSVGSQSSVLSSQFSEGDTIVAVSTAAGRSRRGIVRMSGPRALNLLKRLVAEKHRSALPSAHYRSVAVEIDLNGLRLPARIYLMRAPASYTREDIVEIHTFGNPALQNAILDALTRWGSRPAGPGEFTRRAFLNGRLDLAQAEAVQALIHARDEAEYRAAAAALSGHLSHKITDVREHLADLAAAMEASLDFAEHDIEIISREEVVERLKPLRDEIAQLIGAKDAGRLSRPAPRAVFFGPPNAGKSSVFNAILRRRRAIVSPHPGTTRDTIEATTSLDGVELLLVDTAGLRPSADEVEVLAVTRSHQSVRHADLALCVLDAGLPPDSKTRATLKKLDPERVLILLNKSDLGPCHRRLAEALPNGVETFRVCALDGSGLNRLLAGIRERVERGAVERSPSELMVNARQLGLLRQTLQSMDQVLADGEGPQYMDLAANDIREALDLVSELTGVSGRSGNTEARWISEEILNRIFSTFCIGK